MAKALVEKTRYVRGKTLSREEVKQAVYETLEEFFHNFYDPDEGRDLRPEFIKKLKRSIADKESGRVISFEKVLKNW